MEKIGIEQFRHQEKMISSEAYLQLLFDYCEDGKLLLARDGRYSRQFEGEKPVSVFKEPQYLCTMVWDEAGFAKLLEEFSELKSKLECLAPYYWDMKPGENEVAKTFVPSFASPAATPIMFCSAMPVLIIRSGNSLRNRARPEDWARSAERT